MDFGTLIKEKRKKLGLTQAELAKLLNISASALTNYERNKRIPPLLVANKMATILDINFYDFGTFTIGTHKELTPDKQIKEHEKNFSIIELLKAANINYILVIDSIVDNKIIFKNGLNITIDDEEAYFDSNELNEIYNNSLHYLKFTLKSKISNKKDIKQQKRGD